MFGTKTFSQMLQDWAAAAQGACATLLDLAEGSILRAAAQASAGISLWLQGLVLHTLTVARLATSSGSDVDSFIADFGLTRLPAVAASGLATFARFTATQQAVVPIGALVQTADGSQTFAVIVDTTNSAYSAALGGYVIAANVASVSVPVQALTAGVGGNIVAGVLTVLQTGISGVDTVTNASAFANGLNAETDAAVKLRFIAFILSLRTSTPAAIAYAIAGVQQGLTQSIIENENFNGSARPGYFTVVVDDGSGDPPSSLLTAIYTAINAVRPITVSFGVFDPNVTTINISGTLVLAAGFDRPTVVAAVTAVWTAYVAALGMNQTLPYTKLAQLAYDASPGVIGLTGLLLNSGTSDIVANPTYTVHAGTIAAA